MIKVNWILFFLHEYFNYFGIGNKEKAFSLYLIMHQNKDIYQHNIMQNYVMNPVVELKRMRSYPLIIIKNQLIRVTKGHALGQFKIGYFYYKRISTRIQNRKNTSPNVFNRKFKSEAKFKHNTFI